MSAKTCNAIADTAIDIAGLQQFIVSTAVEMAAAMKSENDAIPVLQHCMRSVTGVLNDLISGGTPMLPYPMPPAVLGKALQEEFGAKLAASLVAACREAGELHQKRIDVGHYRDRYRNQDR